MPTIHGLPSERIAPVAAHAFFAVLKFFSAYAGHAGRVGVVMATHQVDRKN